MKTTKSGKCGYCGKNEADPLYCDPCFRKLAKHERTAEERSKKLVNSLIKGRKV